MLIINELVLIVIFAFGLDLLLGDPRSRYHTTAWIGLFIAKLTITLKSDNEKYNKIIGVFLVLIPCITITSVLTVSYHYSLYEMGDSIVSLIIFVLIWTILLKMTIAIKGMELHALSIFRIIEDISTGNNGNGDIKSAREQLSMIVKRPTKDLDKQHIISGTVESIAENTVDGVTGPIFYFAFFGVPGAFIYRIINTIDSMIGYKTWMFENLGWFGANCDKILNYIPSRLTGLIMVLGAGLLGYDWQNSYRVMSSDARKLSSPNAGYPIAALAGALCMKLEKIDHYEVGSNNNTDPSKEHYSIIRAIKLMKITSILFCSIVTIPLILLFSYIGWWIHA